MCSKLQLRDQLRPLFCDIEVSAWKLLLRTPNVYATTSMIRGVWGRALKHLDEDVYDRIFVGRATEGQTMPRYILRPATPDPESAPALEWILFNVEQRDQRVLWKGWDIACGMGLGSERNPFIIRERKILSPNTLFPEKNLWTLEEAFWPLSDDSASTPCVLLCEVPLRLIKQGKLIRFPEFTDLMSASIRRIANLSGLIRGERYRDLMRAVRYEANKTITNPWIGQKSSLVRWSAAQQREIELYGISGSITLPKGSGHLWPLLAASQWTHIGKGTVYGMGQIRIANL